MQRAYLKFLARPAEPWLDRECDAAMIARVEWDHFLVGDEMRKPVWPNR
jgi:hypothetical protein